MQFYLPAENQKTFETPDVVQTNNQNTHPNKNHVHPDTHSRHMDMPIGSIQYKIHSQIQPNQSSSIVHNHGLSNQSNPYGTNLPIKEKTLVYLKRSDAYNTPDENDGVNKGHKKRMTPSEGLEQYNNQRYDTDVTNNSNVNNKKYNDKKQESHTRNWNHNESASSEKSHLKNKNISYGKHFKQSMKFSGKSLKASMYFFIHAISPNTFETNGSNVISKLNNNIKNYNLRGQDCNCQDCNCQGCMNKKQCVCKNNVNYQTYR